MLKNFLTRQIQEIKSSQALQAYGLLLTLVHPLTAYFWWRDRIYLTLTDQLNPLCWPFFQTCHEHRFSSAGTVTFLLVLYVACSVATGALMFSPRHLRFAYGSFFALNLFKAFFFVQDYRFMGNYHYMPFVMSFAYLFWPNKRQILPLLLVGFYFSAGLLKLSPEWISGASVGRSGPFRMPLVLVEWGSAWVILLELAIAPLLLCGVPIVRKFSLFQLVFFHAMSWHWVGFFYPIIMSFLLGYFPLTWWGSRGAKDQNGMWPLKISTIIAIFLFVTAQMAPAFFPGDSALTGEGRIFSLNMFDARAKCESFFLARMKWGSAELSPLLQNIGVRVRCDPLVFYDIAQNICRQGRGNPEFLDLDIYLASRRSSLLETHQTLAVRNFCQSGIHYGMFHHNDWIGQ